MNPTNAAPARILVVDDTEANRDLLVRRLERQGHTTATADNGRVALAMLREAPFDLVLLDIMMPEMDGYELLQILQQDAQFKHLPVILISALNDTDSMAKGIAMGADDFLPKPFNQHILKARVAASLAKKRLHDREQVHARALERELDIAREIQSGFLPQQLPAPGTLQLAAWFQPARQVGGDFYDAFEVRGGSRQRIAVVMADVCDKGVGAALFMALIRSLVRALTERIVDGHGDLVAQAGEVVASVNDYIARTHDNANMFATLFFGLLDTDSGELVYVNGGHEAALVIHADGVRSELAPTGPAVGMLPELDFQVRTTTLAAGETLVLYTDGVTDAHDAEGAMFSLARLRQVASQPRASAAAMVDAIRAALHAHVRDVAPFDDITLLVAQRSR